MKHLCLFIYILFSMSNPFFARACGPEMVPGYLSEGDEGDIVKMPPSDNEHEIRRLLGIPPATRQRIGYYWGEDKRLGPRIEAETKDLRAALTEAKFPLTRINDLATSYAAMRKSMSSLAYYKDAPQNFDITPYEPLLKQLPDEFSLYVEGAVAFRAADYSRAIAAWTQLLSLPEKNRRHRSIWAAYMIGKAWLRVQPEKSAPFFERCRELAKQGFPDSVGLAHDSLGWQGLAEVKSGFPRNALHSYAQMAIESPYHELDMVSIGETCGAIFEKGLSDPGLVRDPLIRKILTAEILDSGSMEMVDGHYTTRINSISQAHMDEWTSTVLKSGIHLPPIEADDMAWMCYNLGQMVMAEHWLAASTTHTIIGKWVQTKLYLRDGDVDGAIALLKEMQKNATSTRTLSKAPGTEPVGEKWSYERLCADLGILLLGKKQYAEALDAFARGGSWKDAAYLAERVLTPEELEKYILEHRNDPGLQINRIVYYDSDAEGTVSQGLNYILGRRLARLRQWDRALPFLTNGVWEGRATFSPYGPGESRSIFSSNTYKEFVELIKVTEDRNAPSRVRAQAFYGAGLIARRSGMEIFGTELDPDDFIYGGDYSGYSPLQARLGILNDWQKENVTPKPANIAQYLSASAEERRRVFDSEVYPNDRFHYRSYASDLMWQSAELLPDNDPLLAKALWHGGRFTRDDKFYKALVLRCRKLSIGQAADKLRHLPFDMPVKADTRSLVIDYILDKITVHKVNPVGSKASVRSLLTIYVDSMQGDDRNDGSTWFKSKRTIGEALEAVRFPGGSVWVAKGVYPESVKLERGVTLYGGFTGSETSLSQRSLSNLTLSVIDAKRINGSPATEHAVVMDGTTSTVLDGFWIRGGDAHGANDGIMGGGIFCRKVDASNEIRNCIISNCKAAVKGAGAFLDRSSPRFLRCSFVNNHSSDSGGGLACIRDSAPRMEQCVWANNGARFGQGGGIYCENSTPVLDRCWIAGNWCGLNSGGGIFLQSSTLTMTNCIITGNTAGNSGGGIWATENSSAKLGFCTIVNNRSYYGGGVLYLDDRSAAEFSNCILVGNRKYVVEGSIYKSKLEYCLLHGNLPAYENNKTTSSPLETARDLNALLPGAKDNIGGDPIFAADTPSRSGQWTSRPIYKPDSDTTLLFDENADFSDLAGKVMLVQPNKARRTIVYIVNVANQKTIEVMGDLNGRTAKGKKYRLLDYHLQNGSAALKRGVPLPDVTRDINGILRPSKIVPDIGASQAPVAFAALPDHTPPSSTMDKIPNVLTTNTVDVRFHFSDEESGMKQVQLFYRKEHGEWVAGEISTTMANPLLLDVSRSGDGVYDVATVATDTAGNVEPLPAKPAARIFFVTKAPGKRIFVAEKASGSGFGSDWANAMTSINTAITIAAGLGVHEIWVRAGTYHEMLILPSNIALYGGFDGSETDLAQRNPEKYETIIDARGAKEPDGKEAAHAVVMNGTKRCRLDGFTITGGHDIPGRYIKDGTGSGILCTNTDATNIIERCRIIGNQSRDAAGGVQCTGGFLRLIRCSVLDNQSPSYAGIQIYNAGADIINCVIANNNTLTNTGRRYGLGAAIAHIVYEIYPREETPSPRTLRLVNCTIANNKIQGKTSRQPEMGAGLFVTDMGRHEQKSPVIIDCIFANNRSGEIQGFGSSFDPDIRNCLFFDREKEDFSRFGERGPAGITVLQGGEQINRKIPAASGNKDGDPKFVNAAKRDYRLRRDSPAIDCGIDTSGEALGGVTTDLSGTARPQGTVGVDLKKQGDGSGWDIGAYEFNPQSQ